MDDPAAVADAYFPPSPPTTPTPSRRASPTTPSSSTAPTTLEGSEAIGDFYRQSITVPDLKPTPGPYVVDGNRLAVEIDLFVAGNRIHVADFFTIENGKITRLVIYGLPTG